MVQFNANLQENLPASCHRARPRFNGGEALDLVERLHALHSAQTFADLMRTTIDLLSPLIDSTYIAIAICDPRRDRVLSLGSPNDFDMSKYADASVGVADQSALLQYWLRTGDHERIVRQKDCCDVQKFRRTALYNEFLKPLRLTRQMGTWMRAGGSRHLELCLYRGDSEFSDRDMARLAIIRPHIFNAYVRALDRARQSPFIVNFRNDPTLPEGMYEAHRSDLAANADDRAGMLLASLTEREKEVLHWVVAGKTNQEIGIILGTSWRTVRAQLYTLFKKLGVETRTAAAMRGLELGLGVELAS